MPHSYVSVLLHCIFSTKDRRPIIGDELQPRLWAYMGGIARDNGFMALAVGGAVDHAHLLLSLPATIPVAKAVQLVKGGSSKCVSDTFPQHRPFAWQAGYAAFSIGVSQLSNTKRYIASQPEHHQRRTFQEELQAILDKHGVNYDPAHIWH